MPNKRVLLSREDITKMNVDAIVNAANSRLAGGGGVDGAIHRAAGPQLSEACKLLNGCETGSAKLTEGFQLPASYIIHAVGPIWRGGHSNERELLKSCYTTSLEIAAEKGCRSIAFPNISTGIYGFPKEEAAIIATQSVIDFAKHNNLPEIIYFVCFDEENYSLYKNILG